MSMKKHPAKKIFSVLPSWPPLTSANFSFFNLLALSRKRENERPSGVRTSSFLLVELTVDFQHKIPVSLNMIRKIEADTLA